MYKHTAEAIEKIKKAKHWDYHPMWKGDDATYSSIHKWLRRNYGSADKCENEKCPGISTRVEWALIRGKKHSHDRDHYRKLCKHCHILYDGRLFSPASRKKISESMKRVWRQRTPEQFASIRKANQLTWQRKSS